MGLNSFHGFHQFLGIVECKTLCDTSTLLVSTDVTYHVDKALDIHMDVLSHGRQSVKMIHKASRINLNVLLVTTVQREFLDWESRDVA